MEMNLAEVVHFPCWDDLLKWVGKTSVDLCLEGKLKFSLPRAHRPPPCDHSHASKVRLISKRSYSKHSSQVGTLILNSEVIISLISS